jgi:glycosyltransferase involved in cell wall biosynthesis
MNILYVGRNAKIGGGTTFRLNIARGLIPRGHRVWVACRPGEVLPRYREAGVEYVWTPPAPLSAPFLLHAIRRHGIDLVHASNTTPGDAAAFACARTGTPLVLSIHGLLHRNDRHHGCLRLAKRILTFEEAAVRQIERHRDYVDTGKVLLLRRPIEHRPELPAEEEGFRVVYVGRMSRRKGGHALALIEAFASFARELPAARLTLLGDGTVLGEVRRRAAALNRELGGDVVRALGAVPDPAPVVGRAHLLVGASYAALEAIMQGVAVIGAGFWGCGPVSDANLFDTMKTNFGDSGGEWQMTPANFLAELQRLHTAWERGARSPELRQRYWRLDRLIADVHSIDAVAARIESIYEEVLRTPQGVWSPAVS